MTEDIVTFIQGRLDEDKEHAARLYTLSGALDEKHQGSWRDEPHEHTAVLELGHFASRLERSVKSKRRIVDAHGPTQPHMDGTFDYPDAANLCRTCGPGDEWQAEQQPYGQMPCYTIRLLATEWSDHPDYQETWKP